MDLSSYVQAFRVLILLTIVICNCKGQILSQNEEAAFSNDKSNESSEHTEAEPAYTQPIKESDDIQALELPDHTNEHRRKLIHKQKSKPKPTQSLNDEHKEHPFRTSEVPVEQTQENTPSVGRARGFYGFPTGKHRNKKRYIDFRPLNGKAHDLQLRDNLSFGSITNDGIYLHIDEHNYKLPKHRPITEIIQSASKHRYEQSPKFIHSTAKTGYADDLNYLPIEEHWLKKDPKLIHPTRRVKYPTKIGLSTTKKRRQHPKSKVKGNHIYVHGGGVTYIMNKGKLKGLYRPAAGEVGSGGQGLGDDAGQFLPTGELYDMQSEDEAGTTTKLSTRCSTAEPLPKYTDEMLTMKRGNIHRETLNILEGSLIDFTNERNLVDPTYVPNETLEKLVTELGDDQESNYVQKNSNYIPPDRGSTPRHYIDDA